ncbi:200 kDa antigen p200 [Trypanosoma theileri]|uniref:200 kDa antigen p200 n=1 Tax=Trypanosoma theileri TaxID=67003 RepID=A0A1X0P0H8_9TRYP|nr:200 kDa antigen p200 [Trypanosoma theileri]ORC90415.1 200 kDa antigen p200 [Trypanosoma theileri]
MAYGVNDTSITPKSVPRSSGSSNINDDNDNDQYRENLPPQSPEAIVAHYPLGSWERHLMEERIRALKRHEREQLLRAEMERECTFQPRVGISRASTNGVQESHPSQEHQQQQQQQQRVPVFERLANSAKEREARLAQLADEKRRREEAALRNAFHPHVNTVSEHQLPFNVQTSNVPVEERLLHYGRSVQQSRQIMQQQQQRKELEEIRQQQKQAVSRRSRSCVLNEKHLGDIADRSKQILIERETERALAQQALLGEHTFKPKVCITSDAIDRSRNAKKDIRDRGVALYEDGMRRQQERQAEAARRLGEERSGLHKPTTNPLTNDWIQHGQHRSLFHKDFVKRQEIYQRVREEHQRNLASALEQNERAAVLRVDQDMIEQQVERLYLNAQEVRKEVKKRREDHIKAKECPFRPQLAPGTAYVIAHTNREKDVVKRLASVPRNRRAFNPSIFDVDEEENETTEKNSHEQRSAKVVTPNEATEFYQRQKQALEKREAQLRQQKQQQAMEELCVCTFRPRTSTDEYLQRRQKQTSSEGEQHVEKYVSGVTAYLQRQAEAKQRLKEKEEKYNNLGRGLPCNGPKRTIITPFNLSSGRGARSSSLSPSRGDSKHSGMEYHDVPRQYVDPCSKNDLLLALRGRQSDSTVKSYV